MVQAADAMIIRNCSEDSLLEDKQHGQWDAASRDLFIA